MTAIPPTLVFDLDGTLVHTAHDIVATLNSVLASEGMAPVPFETALAMVGSGSRALLQMAFAAEGVTLPAEKLEELFVTFLARYDERLADDSRPFPGTAAMLDRFAGDGWLLAICTNKYEAPAKKLMSLIGLDDRFAAITGQNTFAFCKPDGRHITETVRLAGGNPRDAIMVGDSITDISAAQSADIPVVAVEFGYSRVPVAELGATRVIAHFDELYETVRDIRGAG
jgi:phosphoglycolate phosphatase